MMGFLTKTRNLLFLKSANILLYYTTIVVKLTIIVMNGPGNWTDLLLK